jgi:FAD/FMN-containing dehydrogenase
LAPVDLVLSTAKLNHVLAHRHGDLTATVQAGATLADVNRTLATHWTMVAARSAVGGSLHHRRARRDERFRVRAGTDTARRAT